MTHCDFCSQEAQGICPGCGATTCADHRCGCTTDAGGPNWDEGYQRGEI